ncbi:class I SAM-dependent methyltransferase [Kibdelosporangium aridum]|uniref:class I SAM-dependent methyltransferase n=1 Tax=Kibdelosporangium aridum TaxID=2030 RepID=UPI00068974EB|nr:class I SAM-dependent methyltransferase [Kibdelosporangium aridum]
MSDVDERLAAPGARIADVGCGEGWSTIALARRYPNATVIGYDLDEASVEAARANAKAAEVDAVFEHADAAAVPGGFDAALVFEALHDFARPVEVLGALRSALADGGTLLVVDERVAESFTAPGDQVERLMYGWSVTHCLPAALAEQPSAGLGTVLRPATVRELASKAGFDHCTEVPVENDFFRLYRLDR